MRGNSRVLAALNEALKSELTAINQYFVHAEMEENWAYDRLYKTIRERSITEMRHAEAFIERILFLEGEPNMSDLFQIRIGKNVKQMMENDLALELEAVSRYNASIQLCREEGDNGSRELFERILKQEEEHVDEIESELNQIREIGVERFLSQQIRKP